MEISLYSSDFSLLHCGPSDKRCYLGHTKNPDDDDDDDDDGVKQ